MIDLIGIKFLDLQSALVYLKEDELLYCDPTVDYVPFENPTSDDDEIPQQNGIASLITEIEYPGVLTNHYIDSDVADDCNDDDNEIDDDEIDYENIENLLVMVEDNLPCVAPGFNIFEEGQRIDEIKSQNGSNNAEQKRNERLHPICEDGSKLSFCQDLKDLLVQYHCCEEFEKSLMRILHKHLSPIDVQIPFSEVKYSINSGKVRGWKSTLNEYCGGDSLQTSLMFDICRNGCCVFAGPLKESVVCPNCESHRYQPCPQCKVSSSELCSSGTKDGTFRICKHRVANSITYYRPLIPLLVSLVESKEFLLSIKYENDDSNYLKPIIGDKLHAMTWIKHKEEMNEIFELFKTTRNNIPHEMKTITECSLFLSLIYDGIQLFNSKYQDCWPLAFTIENLPPTLRSKPGIGSFLLSILTENASNSTADGCRGVEYFLFRDCLVEELLILSKGLLIQPVVGDHIFLQARMLLTSLDGRAAEGLYNFQGSGSKTGCALCGAMPGKYLNTLKKVIYYNHRKFLPYDSILRRFGQSKLCCPVDPNDRNASLIHNNERNICCFPVNENINLIGQQNQWFHHEYPFELFQNFLNYEHLDYRKYLKRLPIRKQEEVLKLSLKSQLFYNKVRRKSKRRIPFLKNVHKRKKAPKSGFKGLCPIYRLNYFRVEESLCCDPFHVIKGILTHILEWLKGESANSRNVKDFCKSINVHQCLWEYNDPPWIIPESVWNLIDEIFAMVFIPTNESEHYELKNGILRRSGMLKGAAQLRFLINYMDFFVFVAKLPEAYAALFSMLSSDIAELYEPISLSEDVPDLTNRIIETLCTIEGMIPASEGYMLSHQMIHLSSFRYYQGSVKNTSTLGAERYVGAVGNQVKIGGRNFIKTLYHRFITLEQSESLHFSSYLRFNTNNNPYIMFERNEEDGTEKLIYSEFRYFLTGKSRRCIIPNIYFWGSLIGTLLLDIEHRSSSFADAMSSPLYQLVMVFTTNSNRNDIVSSLFASSMFASWIFDCNFSDEYQKVKTIQRVEIPTFFKEELNYPAMVATIKYLKCLRTDGLRVTNSAFIAGKKFPSRGMQFQEIEMPKAVNNYKQYLHDNLFQVSLSQKAGKDSLCKICVSRGLYSKLGDVLKRDFKEKDRKSVSNHILFGRNIIFQELIASINGYFRVQLPDDDRYTNGVPFAAVNCWTMNSHCRLSMVDNSDEVSYFPAVRFVPIRQIVPSRLALSCMDAKKTILLKPESFWSPRSKNTILLEMDRPRRSIMNILQFKTTNIYSHDNDELN
jgi:hypothetical protein